jgi:hypothetical protein
MRTLTRYCLYHPRLAPSPSKGGGDFFRFRMEIANQSIIVWTLKNKPFVLSLSKHERHSDAPFGCSTGSQLRVNGDSWSEAHLG